MNPPAGPILPTRIGSPSARGGVYRRAAADSAGIQLRSIGTRVAPTPAAEARMEVLDGFIAGIYNYCDRWCETCDFTSQCRSFADRARFEAELDPNFTAIAEAPPLPEDVAPPPPPWLQECIDELNEAAREVSSRDVTEAEVRQEIYDRIAPEHRSIELRARAYSFGTAGWLQKVGPPGERDLRDPRSALWHDCALIPAKIYRALTGLRQWRDDPDDEPADHDGSAKVALLSIDRSRAAWTAAAEAGLAPVVEIEPFVVELGVLTDELERLFPRARRFVRPGFDEVDVP
jgi:hypothetical protein